MIRELLNYDYVAEIETADVVHCEAVSKAHASYKEALDVADKVYTAANVRASAKRAAADACRAYLLSD
jgi:hypothetical protein